MERIDTDGNEGIDASYFNTKGKDRRSKTPDGIQNKNLKFLDMRHLLGFLNQSEWVNTLNIGNIM